MVAKEVAQAMTFRTTLVAAVILVLVGVYVYVFEYKRVTERETQEDQAKKVFDGDWEKLTGLKLTGPRGTFLLEKRTGTADQEAGETSNHDVKPPIKTQENLSKDVYDSLLQVNLFIRTKGLPGEFIRSIMVK